MVDNATIDAIVVFIVVLVVSKREWQSRRVESDVMHGYGSSYHDIMVERGARSMIDE